MRLAGTSLSRQGRCRKLMFTLIENGAVYAPEPLGVQSILLVNERIIKVGAVDGAQLAALDVECLIVDATGCVVTPGFVDPHAHILGAGGEQGFASRAPEVPLRQLVAAGVTTVVGLLGTDTTTRSLAALLGKARQLAEGGVTTYIYTGGFPMPTPTITGSITADLVLIDKVIGIGEIAIADLRSSQPTVQELARLVSAGIQGGMVSGKAGVTHFHTGPAPGRLAILRQLLDEHDIPPPYIYPTHINRTPELMDEGIALARRGCFVDMDTVDDDLPQWLGYYREHGGDPAQLTISSDAHTRGANLKLYTQFVAAAQALRVPLEEMLPAFTCNPAQALKLERKGRLTAEADADVLVLRRDTLDLVHVFARGRQMLRDGQVIVKGRFED
jgi:beta-aspartyl-dipeptidase (metallo-type)